MPKRTSDFAPSLRTLARLTMDRPGLFTTGEALSVVCWLRMQANILERDRKALRTSGRFTARVIRDASGLVAV